MFLETKTLIVVYKDELMLNQLKKLIETKDDSETDGVVGVTDESVRIVAWTEKVWRDQKKAGNIMPRVLKDINPDTGIAQGKKNKTRNFSAFFVFSLFAHLWFVFLCDIMIAQSKGGYCYEIFKQRKVIHCRTLPARGKHCHSFQ